MTNIKQQETTNNNKTTKNSKRQTTNNNNRQTMPLTSWDRESESRINSRTFLGQLVLVSTIVLRKINTRHSLKKALVVILVLGTGKGTRTEGFSKKFQTAVDPHLPPLRMVPISGNHVRFILSGPLTSLNIFDHINYKKNCNMIFRK